MIVLHIFIVLHFTFCQLNNSNKTCKHVPLVLQFIPFILSTSTGAPKLINSVCFWKNVLQYI